MNKNKCLVCKDQKSLKIKFENNGYGLYRCNSCSFVEVFPKLPPSENVKLYNKEYFCSKDAKNCGYADYLNEKGNYLKTFRKRLKFLKEIKHFDDKIKILEIGCAYGFFLDVCEEIGFKDLYGIDISDAGLEYARSHLKYSKILSAQVEEIDENNFDYVFMWDVLEHLYDPEKALQKCNKLLNESGYLIMKMPNVSSLVARILGKRWWSYKMQEHISYFNPKTIRILIESAKFKLVKITSKTSGKYVSKKIFLEQLNRQHPLFSKILNPLPFPKSLYLNFHDEMIVICKKLSNGSNN